MKIKLTIIVMALAICLQQGYTRDKVKVDLKKDSVKHVTSIGSSLNNSSSGNIGKANVATFDMSEVKDINGRYCHNGTDKLVSGRVIKMKKGVKEYEFHLKDGIKHGRFRYWNNIESAPWPALDAVFDMGELVKFQEWWSYDVENCSPQLNLKVWEGSTSPWQVIKEGWNRDGTPTKPSPEKVRVSFQENNPVDPDIYTPTNPSPEKVKVRFQANNPVNPDIYIDGKYIGQTNFDILDINLAPGEHKVKATSPNYQPLEITIDVQPKGSASVATPDNAGIQQAFRLHLYTKE